MGFFYLVAVAYVTVVCSLLIRGTWQVYQQTTPVPKHVRVIPSVYDWEQEGAA